MQNDFINAQHFVADLEMQDPSVREYMLKAIEAYCFANKTDLVDFEKLQDWLVTQDPAVIEKQTLPRAVRRNLQRMKAKPKKANMH